MTNSPPFCLSSHLTQDVGLESRMVSTLLPHRVRDFWHVAVGSCSDVALFLFQKTCCSSAPYGLDLNFCSERKHAVRSAGPYKLDDISNQLSPVLLVCVYIETIFNKIKFFKAEISFWKRRLQRKGGAPTAIDCIVTNGCEMGTPWSYENKAGSDMVVWSSSAFLLGKSPSPPTSPPYI